MTVESALRDTLISPNVADSNMEAANVVDAIAAVGFSVGRLSRAITPAASMAGTDACGSHVESLTEAVMGMTAGLCRIAESIDGLAAAVRSQK